MKFFQGISGFNLTLLNETIISGIPGIDPHRLHEADPTELAKAFDLSMQHLETLEAEIGAFVSSRWLARIKPVIPKRLPLPIPSFHCKTKIANCGNGSEICDNRTVPVVAEMISHRPRLISRPPTNWNEKPGFAATTGSIRERKPSFSHPFFQGQPQRKPPKSRSQTGARKVSP